MNFAHGETVTIASRVPGDPDRYNKPTYTWVSVSVAGCGFDPGISSETTLPYRGAVSTTPTLYAPPGTAVASTDRITVRGKTYEVEGEPSDYRSPFTGWNPGIVVKLTLTEG